MLNKKQKTIFLAYLLLIFSAVNAEVGVSFTDSLAKAGKLLLVKPEISVHSSIENFAGIYAESNGRFFEKIKISKAVYFKTIEKIFTQHSIPVELKYLAVVESKMNTGALSGCGALGLWQFMPATGKRFGLKINATLDERKHVWKSTVAAAKYLDYLHDLLGDWLLVIASYNSGPAPVLNAIKKSGSRDFWKLQYFLPKETRMHVKKFIATHHYFEGSGSLVTMGNEDAKEYAAGLEALKTAPGNNENKKQEAPSSSVLFSQWVAVVSDDKFLKLLLKK
jgi:membrane-bound lytic murein transglycosylase D